MLCLDSRPQVLMASSSRNVPVPSTSAVYCAISNETLTWLCAPRLYTSDGLKGERKPAYATVSPHQGATHCTCDMMCTSAVESVKSP